MDSIVYKYLLKRSIDIFAKEISLVNVLFKKVLLVVKWNAIHFPQLHFIFQAARLKKGLHKNERAFYLRTAFFCSKSYFFTESVSSK